MRKLTGLFLSAVVTFYCNVGIAQDPDDYLSDGEEHARNASRLYNLQLTGFEITMTIAALVLFIAAYKTQQRGWGVCIALWILGSIAALPIFLLVMGLVMTTLNALFFLACFVGLVYLIVLVVRDKGNKVDNS